MNSPGNVSNPARKRYKQALLKFSSTPPRSVKEAEPEDVVFISKRQLEDPVLPSPKRLQPTNKQEKGLSKEELRKQKQIEKEQKEKERLELKERKEREKQEAKEKKDLERKELRDRKDAEKREMNERKEEERRKKEEEKAKKEEVKAKKEEEKAKKEEEKLREEQRIKEDKEKIQKAFKSFFKKQLKSSPNKVEIEQYGQFKAFECKADQRLAPIHRISEMDLFAGRKQLDEVLSDGGVTYSNYLKELRMKLCKKRASQKTWPFENDLMEIADSSVISTYRVKFLSFHENTRPAYYGTWRRRSKTVAPRQPMAHDQALDYEIDSDDEWEEEPGESLSNSEGEDEVEAEEPTSDGDDEFCVPHGYLSDDEGNSDDERQQLSTDLWKEKEQDWEKSMRKTTKVQKPFCIGVCYGAHDLLDFMQPVRIDESELSISCDVDFVNQKTPDGRVGKKPMTVPEEAYPDLIRLVHGNICTWRKLAIEFQAFWAKKKVDKAKVDGTNADVADVPADKEKNNNLISADGTPKANGKSSIVKHSSGISKRQLKDTIEDIAAYEKLSIYPKTCWYVKDAILEKYDLKHISVPTEWDWITQSKKSSITPQIVRQAGTPPSANPPRRRIITNCIEKYLKQ